MSPSSTKNKISRRRVLRGAASALIGLPLLEAMGCDRGDEPGTAKAGADEPLLRAAGSTPVRLVTLMVPNGTVREQWFPTGTPDSYELGPIMAELAPFKDELLILEGVDNPVSETGELDGHREGTVSLLTGWGVVPGSVGQVNGGAGGISLDQHVAARIAGNTRRRSLELGTEAAGPASAITFDQYKQPLPRITHPDQLFAALFGDPQLDADALAALQARRASILDAVADDYRALQPKISASDRQRVDAHLDAIREIELRLSVQAGCEAPDAAYPSAYAPADLPTWTTDTLDLLVLALTCDLSRVASLVYRHGGGGTSYFPWLGLGEDDGVPEHHQMTHELGDWIPELVEIFRWYTAQTAYLIDKLANTPEGEGRLLDNVLIFQASECSDGSIHDKIDMPFLLAGQAGGALETGRWLRYDSHRPHNELLVAIMNLLGVEGSCFGNPYFCEGPLPGVLA